MLSVLQPPPTAEELALKEQVTQMLTRQGVLAKLKAELRAAVFEVMHEREGFVDKYAPHGPKLSDFPMEIRTTAVSLIVECLQFFNWENALRVLLAEINTENEQHDGALLAKQLGLVNNSPSSKPTLFQLIESKMTTSDEIPVPAKAVTPSNYDDFDNEGKDEADHPHHVSPSKTKLWEEAVVRQLPSKEMNSLQQAVKDEANDEAKDEAKDGDGESSAEIEESMAEEVASESELGESNYTNYGDESQDQGTVAGQQSTSLYKSRLQEESEGDDKDEEDHRENDHESETEDSVVLASPPPAPTKQPALPPLVGIPSNTLTGVVEDDFDAEEEAERLRKLDAALQAMEAEDDTGTLQQLKASLQMELQEQDSFASSGGFGKMEEVHDKEDEADTNKTSKDEEEDEDGYGSSDFEEEEVASEISEEMESMPDLSDKDEESEDGAVMSAKETEPPLALRNDTRVASEDALNSYDYIEDVEKGGW